MRKWRKTPAGKKSVRKYRKKSEKKAKEWARDYYKKNKEKINARALDYQHRKPEIVDKSRKKRRELGKGVEAGKKNRGELSYGYIAAQLRRSGIEVTKKSVEIRRIEILNYRLKKAIYKTPDMIAKRKEEKKLNRNKPKPIKKKWLEKPVVLNGVHRFTGVTAASYKTGLSVTAITNNIKGISKKSRLGTWKYASPRPE